MGLLLGIFVGLVFVLRGGGIVCSGWRFFDCLFVLRFFYIYVKTTYFQHSLKVLSQEVTQFYVSKRLNRYLRFI